MSNWEKNKAKARFKSTKETKTDQSQAHETDINVIVNQFLKTGRQPMERKLISGDFTPLPPDLRSFIETGRTLHDSRDKLPPQLRGLTNDQLFSLTPDDLRRILTPAQTPQPANTPTEGAQTP